MNISEIKILAEAKSDDCTGCDRDLCRANACPCCGTEWRDCEEGSCPVGCDR